MVSLNKPSYFNQQFVYFVSISGIFQAYAAARFAESCMRGLDGDTDVYECAYVQSEVTFVLLF